MRTCSPSQTARILWLTTACSLAVACTQPNSPDGSARDGGMDGTASDSATDVAAVEAGPAAPGSSEALLRELCGARPRTGKMTTVKYSTGNSMGALRGADVGDMEAIRLTLKEPLRLRNIRLNMRGEAGSQVRVRLMGDIGRSIPDIEQDLMEPIAIDVPAARWYDVPINPPIDLHPAYHVWIVVEHVTEPVSLLVAAKIDAADMMQGRSRAAIASIVNNRMMNPQGDPWLGLGPMIEYMTEAQGERICPREGPTVFSDQTSVLGAMNIVGRPQWVDIDGDNREDFVSVGDRTAPTGTLSVWHSAGGFAFENRTARMGLAGAGISGANWADLDADGDMDLLGGDNQSGVGPFMPGQGSKIYMQGADGRFVLVDAPLEEPGPTDATAFGDCDGDGELDVYIGQWLRTYPTFPGSSQLFHGLGNGRFEDYTMMAGMPVATGSPARGVAPAFASMWADFDNDGDSDLFVQTYLGAPNWAYVNDGRCHFTERGRTNGFAGTPPTFGTSFGLDFGDYDNDGDLDAFDTNIAHARGDLVRIDRSRLLRNTGAPDFRFENVTAEAGILHNEGDHEGTFGDWDNDGDLDLITCVGPAYGYQWLRLYRQEPDHRFTDVSYLTGMPNLWCGGAMFHDADRDGDLDLGLGSSSVFLLRNDLPATNHWIEVRVRDRGNHNRDAVGARITVTTADGVRRMREVTAGRGFVTGQGPLTQHVGLGSAAGPVTVDVRWPGGNGGPNPTVIQYAMVAADKVYLIERGMPPVELPR